MSLDVHLYSTTQFSEEECRCKCDEMVHVVVRKVELYSGNITHNMNKMADAAGIYQYLWRPEENGITIAGQLIEPLAAGLDKLVSDAGKMMKHNPANGWGNYDVLVSFARSYLAACNEFPDAEVYVSR